VLAGLFHSEAGKFLSALLNQHRMARAVMRLNLLPGLSSIHRAIEAAMACRNI
jgi:hypothetical protein